MYTERAIMTSQFIFITCQVGAEAALKTEIKRDYPALKFAFSRPGFLTFKSEQPISIDFELKSVFTRTYGLSLSKADRAGAIALIRETEASLRAFSKPIHLHIWERDQHKPGEEPKGFVPDTWADSLRNELKRKATIPHDGDVVLDVIAVEENQVWVGAHEHSGSHARFPGAKPEIIVPSEAPSRAYLKLEDAIHWSQAPIQTGDIAVEIGSAPGGASYALLKRGVNVVGIDPGEMSPEILKFEENFSHIQDTVANVRREDLPAEVQWLLLDMNVAHNVALFQVDRLASRMLSSLLGVFLTIKLNEWKIAEQIPSFLEHIKAMGMVYVRATQLASNKQEFLIYGLTRRGVARYKGEKPRTFQGIKPS
jgi:23S rRNA (cytidine2498-2'-O)-methyltransferase